MARQLCTNDIIGNMNTLLSDLGGAFPDDQDMPEHESSIYFQSLDVEDKLVDVKNDWAVLKIKSRG